ncbi:hypothetical protein H6F76_09190 [Leptolyngbya sp. FACHB-321]|uniref:hypothetical protein n=1 Tax=Leptolyngbya sp. FACHB-321 TaxID=2692807 RepID=UPI0016895B4F|nr:hypothetical protein [Leptolyngbya sp. FACHB-321]MBD2035201.1 hypothetical protein [Leptolyngbya sp. FACHB-321]
MTTLIDKPTPSVAKNTPPALKALFRPMLALALGIHGLLLFVPLSPEKKELPEPTEKPVKISRLSNQKVVVKPTPKSRVVASKPIVKRNVSSPPRLVVKATPKPLPATSSASAAPASTSAAPASNSSATPLAVSSAVPIDNTPSSDPEAAAFAGPLDAITRSRTDTDGVEKDLPVRDTSVPIGSILFKDPAPFFADPEKDLAKPGISGLEYLGTLNDLEAALKDDIEPAYTGNGFTFEKVGNYGDGPVYEVKKDEVTRYLNFVLNKTKTGILVVVWKKSPV